MREGKEIRIGRYRIGLNHPPFIIAEMSGNHNQSIERAMAIVEAAACSGAHALKIQTYTADTITLDVENGDFFISNPDNAWSGQSLHKLYQKAYTPWEWHEVIFKRCKELGLEFFSTPFDETAVDFLERLEVPCYKIASFENNHLPLIRKVARTGKPVIMSTGMATIAEIDEAVRTLKQEGGCDIILLKCTSSYPAPRKDANVRTIPHLRELFECEVGLSDHTLGLGVALAAVAHGATVIEKHFTLQRGDGGVDAAFSMEPAELSALVTESVGAWESLGEVHYGMTEVERTSTIFRRSIYVAKDIEENEAFTEENLKIVRPGKGLHPRYWEVVLGMRAKCSLKKGMPLKWDSIG